MWWWRWWRWWGYSIDIVYNYGVNCVLLLSNVVLKCFLVTCSCSAVPGSGVFLVKGRFEV